MSTDHSPLPGSPPVDPVAMYVQWRREHPGCGVSPNAVTAEGFALGRWVRRMRTDRAAGRMPQWRRQQLDEVDFTWSGAEDRAEGSRYRSDQRWAEMLQELVLYRDTYGDVVVPSRHVSPSGNQLGAWLSRAQQCWRRGTLTPERIDQLHHLGVRQTRDSTLAAGLASVLPGRGF